MSSPCANNAPGQRKPGESQFQTYTGALIGEILTLRGMPFWASTAVGIAIAQYDMDALCRGDPPPLPTIGPDRYLGYFNPLNPQGAAQLRQDMEQLFGHYLWYIACECSSGAQPPFPSPFPPVPNVDPTGGTKTTPTGPACGAQPSIFESKNFDASGNITWDWQIGPAAAPAVQWISWLHNGADNGTGSSYPVTHSLDQLAANGTTVLDRFTYTQSALIPAATPQHYDVKTVPGVTSYRLTSHTDTGAGVNFGAQVAMTQYCNAPPGVLDEPCCPPDETVLAYLNQIVRLLQELLARGTGAIGYRLGTPVPGRAGSASLPLSSNVGVLVDITAGVPTTPQLPGNPAYQWDLGWMSMMTGDGMIEEKRITRQHQLWLPAIAPLSTVFGYYLNPGVVATFTPLLAPT